MTIVNKPDFTLFASEAKTGEVDTFPNLLRGWGVTLEQTAGKPPMEWFNALQQRTDHWLMYLSQRGIPAWDSRLTYPLFAVVQHAGKFYVAQKESTDQPPDTSQNVWMSMAAALDLPAGSLTEKGMLQLSSATDSDSETMAATPKAVKALAAQTLAKDQNGADIPDNAQFVDNLGLSVAVVSVGVPLPWPTENPPAGWIACDGKAFDKKTCPQLAAIYPSGKTPDLRGEFIRGWDNGKNIDTGRKLLSYQNGTLTGGKDDNNDGTDISFLANGGMVDYGGDTPKAENYPGASLYYAGISAPKTPISHLPSFYSVTRPCNIAFNYIVRAA